MRNRIFTIDRNIQKKFVLEHIQQALLASNWKGKVLIWMIDLNISSRINDGL